MALSVQPGDDYNAPQSAQEVEATTRFYDPEDPKVTILPQVENTEQLRNAFGAGE